MLRGTLSDCVLSRDAHQGLDASAEQLEGRHGGEGEDIEARGRWRGDGAVVVLRRDEKAFVRGWVRPRRQDEGIDGIVNRLRAVRRGGRRHESRA
jgi:hypothetical protein